MWDAALDADYSTIHSVTRITIVVVIVVVEVVFECKVRVRILFGQQRIRHGLE
jgi:hypothetical protein